MPNLTADKLFDRLRASTLDSFKLWMVEAKALQKQDAPEEVVRYCKARAYISIECDCDKCLGFGGFYHYCVDILKYTDLTPEFHGPMCQQTSNPKYKLYTPDVQEPDKSQAKRRYRMIQAARGTFKTSVSTVGYGTWRIAREMTLEGTCNIRILIACEILNLATSLVKGVRQELDWNDDFKTLFGSHKPGTKDARHWSDNAFTSRFRTMARLREPTVSALSLDAPRAGFHYDLILADDLETERSSATAEQIDKCWDLYRLMHSLLEPTGEMVLISTRWHYDDIYSRILKANVEDYEEDQYSVFIMPVQTKDGDPTFPSRFSRQHIDHLRTRHGSYLFGCQYLLNPIPDEDRTFKSNWLGPPPPTFMERKIRAFMGVDFAYTDSLMTARGEIRKADYTVILVILVDEFWNYCVHDVFRERCTKLKGITQMFNMYYKHKCLAIGLQKYDRTQVEDVIAQQAQQQRRKPKLDWVKYSHKTQDLSKKDRIKTSLQPIAEAGKLFIPTSEDYDWLRSEFKDFPLGRMDGLDAFCNVIKCSKPPHPNALKPKESAIMRHIRSLKSNFKGVVNLQGKREGGTGWEQI